ncbi:MAG: maltotransferase domain-containing protein, partial [Acidimicrobiia bacterium]
MGRLKPTDSRVVIESVEPCVDDGRFPVKRPLGDPVEVTARVFADGHDSVSAVLRYRRRGRRSWAEIVMESRPNDKWRARFTPTELGDWEFEVAGWVDHFTTWREAMVKRVEAGADVSVELMIGAELVSSTAARCDDPDRKMLTDMAAVMGDGDSSPEIRLDVAFADDLAALMSAHPD